MKPCSQNRKLIAWLALGALDARQARDLRAHLETCEGCRRYREEITMVTKTLVAAETRPDLQASASFHRKVVGKLRAVQSASLWEILTAQLRTTRLNWRVALPVIGATIALIAALFFPTSGVRYPSGAHTASATRAKADLPPTIANYQRIANQSLEQLDELLTRQGNRNPPPIRVYTASSALD